MKIFIITMIFPAKSETFAAHDVLSYHEKGTDVSVHSLRKKIKGTTKLTSERSLENIRITHSNLLSVINGICFGMMRISILLDLFSWIVKNNINNKIHLLKSIILIPRSLDIIKTIKKEKPDIVHLFWGHLPSIVGYLVEKYCSNSKLTMFLGAYDLEMNYNGSGIVARDAKVVFTHAKYNVPWIMELGVNPQNIIVSYRGVNLGNFKIEENPRKEKRRIVCASRLIESKGVDKVINIFADINLKYPDSTLVILGDGNKRPELEEMVKLLNLSSVVTFKGHVNQEILFEEMKKAEVFMLLSKKQSERLPNVVKEAMLAKCLCIVTETPGIEELVEDGKSGYVVNLEYPNKIHEIIDKVFVNKSNKEEIIKKGFSHITNNFDIKKLAKNYINNWKEIKNQVPK
ncbi:glycosyltransferase [Alteribacillus sp. YIM 98480]|uniref:glycosyltransferase n=1 Tax=Alteribacillus sp. YIM 98480 TaxID=2606599 RepID=UPI00131A70D4|nr:glycosyltransferase [Alteribacillus sp. YIM 98480]